MCGINMQGMSLRLKQNRGQMNLEEVIIKPEKAFLTKANLKTLNVNFFQFEETRTCIVIISVARLTTLLLS